MIYTLPLSSMHSLRPNAEHLPLPLHTLHFNFRTLLTLPLSSMHPVRPKAEHLPLPLHSTIQLPAFDYFDKLAFCAAEGRASAIAFALKFQPPCL